MLMPSIFGESLFDEMMDSFNDNFFGRRNPLYGKNEARIMKTDIREADGRYVIDMDLPGFKKEEINAELKDGCLTISAAKSLDKDEQDQEGRYIRRERYAGSMSRSFYIGESIKQEDIKAKFENGILSLSFPKEEEQKKLNTPNYIAIEG